MTKADENFKITSMESAIENAQMMGMGFRPDPVSQPEVAMTDDELTVEAIKMMLHDPKLYKVCSNVMTEHRYPEKLDPRGRQIRRVFLKFRKEIDDANNQTKEGSG